MTNATESRALAIVSRLVAAGYPTYFAGGAVRDRLLGRPVRDIDIATAAPPDVVESLFEKTVPVGKAFGVVRVLVEGESFEVATFRTEGPYRDGRRPSWVSFADAREDVRRRDFTINGLLYDPLRGEIIDWVGGRLDLELRRIRTIGEPRERFAEDKLRMLRAIRLACELDFTIEPRTSAAIRKMASEIVVVSAERIRDELVKLFTGPAPDRGLRLLDEHGLLAPILPEVDRMKGVEQDPRTHPEGDVFTHTVRILSLLRRPSVTLAFAALLHDVGKPATFRRNGAPRFPGHARVGAEIARGILERLRFDRRSRERIVRAVASHLRFRDVETMRPATFERFVSEEGFEEWLELHRLDCLAGNGDLRSWEIVRRRLEERRRRALPPAPLLRGRDLRAMGIPEGPQIGRILAEVEELRAEGRLRTPEEARRWVAERYAPAEG